MFEKPLKYGEFEEEITCQDCGGKGEGPVAWFLKGDGTIDTDIRPCVWCGGTGKIKRRVRVF